MSELAVYFDGACRPWNPRGIATYGFVVVVGGTKIEEGYGLACPAFDRSATNNYAEYTALIKALQFTLEYVKKHETNVVGVYGDSALVINQMRGYWSVKSYNIIPLYKRAVSLKREIEKYVHKVEFLWIPREDNIIADALSNKAFVEYLDSDEEAKKKVMRSIASENQKKLMRKLGIEFDEYISKWEASRLIDRYFRNKRRGRIGNAG